MCWGLGPVFIYECLAASRRWQTYAIRALGVALLLAAIESIAFPDSAIEQSMSWRQYAEMGQAYFCAIVGLVLTLVLLAAPAATAGAICVDRSRGTLSHILMTDLLDHRPAVLAGLVRPFANRMGQSTRELRSGGQSLPPGVRLVLRARQA
jgi:hypothetical protein